MSLNKLKDVFYICCIGVLFWLVLSNKEKEKGIAYIDVKKVFDEFQLKKELQKKYQGQMASKKQVIDSLGFQLQRLEIEIGATKKPDKEKVDLYMSKQKQYIDLSKIYTEEDKNINSEYDSQILNQMNQYVKEYGDENGYEMILGSIGNGNIMQAKSEIDLTKPMIKYINNKYAGVK